jgi:hypothetical protein
VFNNVNSRCRSRYQGILLSLFHNTTTPTILFAVYSEIDSFKNLIGENIQGKLKNIHILKESGETKHISLVPL